MPVLSLQGAQNPYDLSARPAKFLNQIQRFWDWKIYEQALLGACNAPVWVDLPAFAMNAKLSDAKALGPIKSRCS